ncbi:MAG TPA: universal stress protein [Candidatus Binataceae bacterium]|nr:universal stress protein [Candidatus Binataceae bacterium]
MEPSTTKVFSKILCPVDFEHSLDALDFSITLAKQNDATLYVLNVAAIPMGAAELSSSADPEPFWEVTARTRLELLAEEKLVSVTNHELMIRSGDAAVGILQAAIDEGVDVIVMATHGRKGLSHFFVGSVAEQVVRESTCPVLTIRPA